MPIFSSFHIMLTAINGKSSCLTRPTTIIEKRYKRIGTPHINGKGIFPLFHLYINIKANKKIVRRTQSNGLKTILLKEICSHMDKHVLIELKKKKKMKKFLSHCFYLFNFFFWIWIIVRPAIPLENIWNGFPATSVWICDIWHQYLERGLAKPPSKVRAKPPTIGFT